MFGMLIVDKSNVKPRAPRAMRKRPLQLSATQQALLDTQQIAFWAQWRLAMNEVCARLDAAGNRETDVAWQRGEELMSVARHQVLTAEIRHLESQLGKLTSAHAKLQGAAADNAAQVSKAEVERNNAVAASASLEVILLLHVQTYRNSYCRSRSMSTLPACDCESVWCGPVALLMLFQRPLPCTPNARGFFCSVFRSKCSVEKAQPTLRDNGRSSLQGRSSRRTLYCCECVSLMLRGSRSHMAAYGRACIMVTRSKVVCVLRTKSKVCKNRQLVQMARACRSQNIVATTTVPYSFDIVTVQ